MVTQQEIDEVNRIQAEMNATRKRIDLLEQELKDHKNIEHAHKI